MAVHVEGIREFDAAVDRLLGRVSAASERIARRGALLIEEAAKAHMDGRPGPFVRSGTLRRSVLTTSVERIGLATWRARIGPTVIYGRRIELGFYGADRLGRVYHQPPYPYMRPGMDDARPRIEQLARTEWSRAQRG
jgi:hypothetical protein